MIHKEMSDVQWNTIAPQLLKPEGQEIMMKYHQRNIIYSLQVADVDMPDK